MIGTSIAHYRITAKIGAGGMGEVWRATDTKLHRDVALKILPETFSADADRMARFTREAHLLASLNHPNIAAIYGVEELEGRRALVLEMVEGEDLHQRLGRGPMPAEEALAAALQIAGALEAAHEKGIVHRDLKPANVKLTPGGDVKVLDFGLAKALEGEHAASGVSGGEASLSPTLTAAATQAGVVLGTAAYMSPEQARGKRTDRRSDIFSFGAVLFEMLARKACFGGETVSDTLAGVIKDEPSWDRLPPGTDPAVVHLLRRCLHKDPGRRLQAIGEARIVLDAVRRGDRDALAGAAGAASGTGVPRARFMRGWLAVAAAAAVVAGLAGWWLGSSRKTLQPVRFALEPAELALRSSEAPVLSPDGRRIAYLEGGSLWIRDLDSLEPRRVEGAEGARTPFWSPDGASLAFSVGWTLKRVPAGGGEPVTMSSLSFPAPLDGATWAEDDFIYLAPASGAIYRLPARGGDAQPYIQADFDRESDFHTPRALPGGRGLLYTVHRAEGADTIEAFADGSRRTVLHLEGEILQSAVYSLSGHLLYERRGENEGIWAVPFSLASLEPEGEPFLLQAGGVNPSVSRDGTLLYTDPGEPVLTDLVWVGRDGELLGPAGPEMPRLLWPEISPDGREVLAGASVEGNDDIWMLDTDRGTWSRITFDDQPEWQAGWHPDGGRALVSTGGPGLFKTRVVPVDGSGEPVVLIPHGAVTVIDTHSGLAVFTAVHRESGFDLFTMPVSGDGEERPLVNSPSLEAAGEVSPDGRHLVYQSDESGRPEVYLTDFPSARGKRQVSADGGVFPRWSRSGEELFYIEPGDEPSLMAVRVETDPRLHLGAPRRLFGRAEHPDLDWNNKFPARQYDVSPGGEKFLMVRKIVGERSRKPRIVVIQRWIESLEEGKR